MTEPKNEDPFEDLKDKLHQAHTIIVTARTDLQNIRFDHQISPEGRTRTQIEDISRSIQWNIEGLDKFLRNH